MRICYLNSALCQLEIPEINYLSEVHIACIYLASFPFLAPLRLVHFPRRREHTSPRKFKLQKKPCLNVRYRRHGNIATMRTHDLF